MGSIDIKRGFAPSDGAKIYYEMAGSGQPFVMIHAGVADMRQWNHEFAYFAQEYQVIRYDMRGYGQSKPVDGEFKHIDDLTAILDHLQIEAPLILMGCSMGGGLAMDFALAQPARAKALIMVDSAPDGLDLDLPAPSKFEEAKKAYDAQDWDLLAEIETQIWFDGVDRTPDQVNQTMRKLAYEMNRIALGHEAKGLGTRLPNIEPPAAERLNELELPVLVIVGAQDIQYMLMSADYMIAHISSGRKVIIDDAGHLPNMEHPAEFQEIVEAFLTPLMS